MSGGGDGFNEVDYWGLIVCERGEEGGGGTRLFTINCGSFLVSKTYEVV